jgi:IS30 family transposase
MSYTHLTEIERYQIKAILTAGFTQKDMAKELGRSPSTINREMSRISGLRVYRH